MAESEGKVLGDRLNGERSGVIGSHLPTGFARLSGKATLGYARINHHLTEITRLWHADFDQIKAELGRTGNYGGSGGLIRALESLRVRADEGVALMLAELAKAVRTRGWIWHRLHSYAEKRMQEHLSACTAQAVEVMWRGGQDGEQIAQKRVQWIVDRQRAEILMHKEGWTSPPPDSLEARYPILSKIALAIFAFALGVASGPIASTVFPTKGQGTSDVASVRAKPPEPLR